MTDDELKALISENKRLREALEPFSKVAGHEEFPTNDYGGYSDDDEYTEGDLFNSGKL